MLYFARWKIALIVAVLLAAVIMALPNMFPRDTVERWPEFMPKRQIVLGLDLSGGAHLLLQVDRADLIKERITTMVGDIRTSLRDQRIGYRNLRTNGQIISFDLRNPGDADKALAALAPLSAPIQTGLFGQGSVNEVVLERDGGRIVAQLTEEGIDERMSKAVEQSLPVLERRINALGTTEPTIQRQGDDRILIQVPGLEDTQQLKELLGQTAKMTFHMECEEGSLTEALQSRPPAGCVVAQPQDPADGPILIEERARLSGEDLSDAQPAFDQQTNQPIVTFRFNSRGGSIFGQLTQVNVGRRFAVVLDDKVITAPVIRSPILGGSGQIEGNFTPESAQNLAVLLRAGALPAKLDIIEERTVGPSLGRDSIEAGKTASLVGLSLVIGFMILSYGLLGVFAVAALLINLVLLLAVLTFFQATLTLPGIAGIVLTVGMAVDSNVIIFERIRDEARAGRSAISSIDSGFSLALGTIMDSNVTQLISAFAMFALGSGPIRGFAVTLTMGLITTMFTAYTLTRLIMSLWVRSARPKAVPI